MEPSGTPSHDLLPALPHSPESTKWWLVTPDPFAFENITFTHPVGSLKSGYLLSFPQLAYIDLLCLDEGKALKLLACGDCELGPLGWCEVGGNEFWLACSRVWYAVSDV